MQTMYMEEHYSLESVGGQTLSTIPALLNKIQSSSCWNLFM